MPDTPTDQELIDAAARGDKAAFDALYERHRDWVYTLACRFVDRDTAADVVQEVFIYLLRKITGAVPDVPAEPDPSARPAAAPPRRGFQLTARMTTFLYPAVRNSALAIKRKQRRYVGPDDGLLEFLPAGSGPGVGAALDGSESLARLLKAVQRLPVGQQEVLLMRVVDDMSVAEVAAALGIPEGTVKSRLSLALAALRGDPHLAQLTSDHGEGPAAS